MHELAYSGDFDEQKQKCVTCAEREATLWEAYVQIHTYIASIISAYVSGLGLNVLAVRKEIEQEFGT